MKAKTSIPADTLVVKRSSLPRAGKGLFTKAPIPKGTRIVEYKGRITTWKEVSHDNGANGYIYYVNRNYVIDALPFKKAKARFANDARGLAKVKGLTNNSAYVEYDGKVYIQTLRNIEAGEEIFVSYGKEYWDVIRHNMKISANEKRKRGKKS